MATIESQEATGKTNLLFDARVRAIAYQVITVVIVVGFVFWIGNNTVENLQARGIATGFGFLEQPAGFGIAFSLIDYSEASSYGTAFLVGVINTIWVSAFGIILATIIGFFFGVLRISKNVVVSSISAVYLETARNVPLLLQILFWYYAIFLSMPQLRQSINFADQFFINNRGVHMPRPVFESGFGLVVAALLVAIAVSMILARWAKKRQDATGEIFPIFWTSVGLIVVLPVLAYFIAGAPLSWEAPELKGFNFRGGMVIIPEFMALLAALTIYTAAFIGEIVRAGIQAVNHGQTEAAHALGVKPGLTLRLIVIPQAMRVIIPPLTSQYLNLTKNSSLAAAIGYPELVAVFSGTVLNQTGQAIECVALTMFVYLTISLSISAFMNWYNRRIALVER